MSVPQLQRCPICVGGRVTATMMGHTNPEQCYFCAGAGAVGVGWQDAGVLKVWMIQAFNSTISLHIEVPDLPPPPETPAVPDPNPTP